MQLREVQQMINVFQFVALHYYEITNCIRKAAMKGYSTSAPLKGGMRQVTQPELNKEQMLVRKNDKRNAAMNKLH